MKVLNTTQKKGIKRTPEFERKRLATHAVNVGTKCGHGCLYCSTGASLRMHRSFADHGVSPFDTGYAIVDPSTPERVATDARRMRKRGLIQLCTTVDAWSPEAQAHDLGRRCLEAILAESDWTVRILTKNVAVAKDFDLIEKHRDRVLVGLSITSTPDKTDAMSAVEPHASPVADRIAVMERAQELGLRTYAMLCPLLPGIADNPDQIDSLVHSAVTWGVEEIFAEAVNPRGPGLRLTQEALDGACYHAEARAIEAVRKKETWSRYVRDLIANLQRSVRRHDDIERLRVLLYPSNLTPACLEAIRDDDAGVVWLGKE